MRSFEPVSIPFEHNGQSFTNIESVIDGSSGEYIVIGGHYDTARTAPGANDNGTGTAAVLSLARHFQHSQNEHGLRFVAFANEEPPHFKQE